MARNNELIKVAKRIADAWRNTDDYYQAARIIDVLVSELEEMPTLTQPNEPLTFVERREMDRKPVWLDDEKAFGILQFWDDNNVNAVFLDPSGCIRVKSVIGNKIYRRPPEEEV